MGFALVVGMSIFFSSLGLGNAREYSVLELCGGSVPVYLRVKASRTLSDTLILQGVTYYEGSLPVFYFPVLFLDPKDPSSLELPTIGYRSSQGVFFRVQIPYLLTEKSLGQVLLDLRSKGGHVLGLKHLFGFSSGYVLASIYYDRNQYEGALHYESASTRIEIQGLKEVFSHGELRLRVQTEGFFHGLWTLSFLEQYSSTGYFFEPLAVSHLPVFSYYPAFLPFLRLQLGTYKEGLTSIQSSRLRGDVGFTGEASIFNQTIAYGYEGFFAYYGKQMQGGMAPFVSLALPLSQNLSLGLSLFSGVFFGETPFYFDSQQRYMDLEPSLTFSHPLGRGELTASYDILTRSLMPLQAALWTEDSSFLPFSLGVKAKGRLGNLESLFVGVGDKTGKSSLQVGFLSSSDGMRFEGSVQLPLHKYGVLRYTVGYDKETKELTQSELEITMQFACRNVRLHYDFALQQSTLAYRATWL